MDKFEIRRQRLIKLRDERCGGKAAELARVIGKADNYVSRMLYPEGKSAKKRIAEGMVAEIEKAFKLPAGWLDKLDDPPGGLDAELGGAELIGSVKEGIIPVMGEAVLGMNGLMDMMEFHVGWLRIYSADPEAYGVRVKGDSMWPRIQSGEFVVIEPNTTVHPGDEVFVRTHDGHNMIKILNITRDGDYHFTSVNNSHPPITMPANEVDKVHYVSGILKSTRFLSADDVEKR